MEPDVCSMFFYFQLMVALHVMLLVYEERRWWLMCSGVLLQGENVPAPFISFEAAGFPPDLLKEVLTPAYSFHLGGCCHL